MKKLLIIFVIVLTACSSDDIIENSTHISDTELNQIQNTEKTLNDSSQVYTLAEINKLIQKEYEDKGYKQIEILNNTELKALKEKHLNLDEKNDITQTMQGPYTAPAVQTRLQKNKKIIIANGEGGLATGVYFGDVYSFKAEIQLPPNSIGFPEVPDPVGYNNLASFELGITSYTNNGSNGTELIIHTYTIHVRFNELGQHINKVIPTALQDGFDYTYYYITPEF